MALVTGINSTGKQRQKAAPEGNPEWKQHYIVYYDGRCCSAVIKGRIFLFLSHAGI